MNNDIVVKQKPGEKSPAGLTVKPAPQSDDVAIEAQTAPQEQKEPPANKEAVQSPEKSNKPVGVIAMAIIIALCLITITVYIGYNQSQVI
jgi:uncharacterized protein HemX